MRWTKKKCTYCFFPLLLFALSVALTHTHTRAHSSLALAVSLSFARAVQKLPTTGSALRRAARRGYSHPRALSCNDAGLKKGGSLLGGQIFFANVTLKNGTWRAIQTHIFMFQESRNVKNCNSGLKKNTIIRD